MSDAVRAWDDRLNAVLVKEVRQAMRGAYFRRTFLATLSAALTVGLFTLAVTDGRGPTFFLATYGCFVVALLVLVPVLAYFSLGAEREENTLDLLLLSNLRPRQVVAGKFLASGVVALLFVSAFAPFLGVAALLPGNDVRAIGFFVAVAIVGSGVLSLYAIAVSTYGRARFLRVFMLVALFAGLAGFTILLITIATQFFQFLGWRDELLEAFGYGVAVCAVLGAYAFNGATVQLAHPEENRSTGLRLLGLVAVLGAAATVATLFVRHGYDDEALVTTGIAMLALSLLPGAIQVTEPDVLPRRTALYVPRGPVAAFLATPFLPGGGRGLVFHLLVVALMAAIGLLLHALLGPPGTPIDGARAYLGMACYATIWLGLPSLARRRVTRHATIVARRGAVLVFPVAMVVAPILLGVMIGDRGMANGRHAGNPFVVLEGVWDWRPSTEWLRPRWIGLIAAALFVLLLNAPRIAEGFREVQAASRARRAREAAERAGAA